MYNDWTKPLYVLMSACNLPDSAVNISDPVRMLFDRAPMQHIQVV